jgi:hypothetical protein
VEQNSGRTAGSETPQGPPERHAPQPQTNGAPLSPRTGRCDRETEAATKRSGTGTVVTEPNLRLWSSAARAARRRRRLENAAGPQGVDHPALIPQAPIGYEHTAASAWHADVLAPVSSAPAAEHLQAADRATTTLKVLAYKADSNRDPPSCKD